MYEIHGNTEGIRQTELTKLKALYLAELDSDTFITDELACTLAEASARLNRELALYISRSGEILDVVIGDNSTVSLPEYRLRRNANALSRVRVIHTHPSGTARLSELDLTALISLKLDAMCALGVNADGKINGISAAFITGWAYGQPQIPAGRRDLHHEGPDQRRRGGVGLGLHETGRSAGGRFLRRPAEK